ncbi:MAG TPA: GNAT family N-acetyltransferase [Rectinemataceae bacterium]|nr:GNAT family N-acetyltransferase [Rectinemataceae bacterium]
MEEQFEILPFTLGDYEEAFALWSRTPGMGLTGADRREPIASFLERNPGLSFAAKLGGELVGTALCGSDGRRGYLYHLAVDPKLRRKGLGARLASACLEALAVAGIEKCHLFLITGNELGAAFWSAVGWARRDDIIVYSRNLESAGLPSEGERIAGH